MGTVISTPSVGGPAARQGASSLARTAASVTPSSSSLVAVCAVSPLSAPKTIGSAAIAAAAPRG